MFFCRKGQNVLLHMCWGQMFKAWSRIHASACDTTHAIFMHRLVSWRRLCSLPLLQCLVYRLQTSTEKHVYGTCIHRDRRARVGNLFEKKCNSSGSTLLSNVALQLCRIPHLAKKGISIRQYHGPRWGEMSYSFSHC